MNKIIKNFKNIKYGPSPEDDSEVLKWIKNLPNPNHNFIGGEWKKSSSKKNLISINPGNNKKLFNLTVSSKKAVSYTHLTLPTNREV